MIGGGCASLAAAFELTRPELKGAYHVTVYQVGWRLGGKGASGRGAADRIEEHGLHIWLGFYENAFRLIRDCYHELGRDSKKCPIASWEDAFYQDSHVGVADKSGSGWLQWTAFFPPAAGRPGDPLWTDNPFTIAAYTKQAIKLVQALLLGVQTRGGSSEKTDARARDAAAGQDAISDLVKRTLKYGLLGTTAGLAQLATRLDMILDSSVSRSARIASLESLREITRGARKVLERLSGEDDETRYVWEIIDLVVAILTGIVRFGIVTDRRGFDAINDYECREWLKLNGASESSVNSAFVRGLFDLAMAYPGGDVERPALAAGQAVRGALRMFFTYRGALFWKMRAGMGDIVFAPLYEVLKKRGVSFRFFHRLENVRLVDPSRLRPGERRYVEALDFDVQAQVKPRRRGDEAGTSDVEYEPLIDVRGLPCWPSAPKYEQLVAGERMRREGVDFESFWDKRNIGSKTLLVGEHFDLVVLGIGIGAIRHVCRDLVESDARWRDMVDHVQSVPTQAFQVWMSESMQELGWPGPPVSLSAFVKPFDTWADMTHLAQQESWPTRPRSIAYFCSVLADPPVAPARSDADYPRRRKAEVRDNAIRFLKNDVVHLWPKASDAPASFRWRLLLAPDDRSPADMPASEAAFDSQYWTANVNPSDRYVLALPGSIKYRISPLDNTYDNLTIAGDWTACGFTEGCVEAAVMSGRLAAHALAKSPSLAAIIGYDHP
ncbi:MAG TPA: FAD-dependent oxidoreductase [Gammaproteobacteria bacterium]|nr:FAD-dependent oxidoreductase [Gammaproteobacteria bacterium]